MNHDSTLKKITDVKDNVMTKISIFNFEHLNLSPYTIFLFVAIIIIIIILILRYGLKKLYYIFNQNLVNLFDFEKIYMSSPTLVSIVDNPNYQKHALCEFFVKTAYNCCCSSNFKNSYVNLGSLEICISQGVRCLDFEIHAVDNNPVVAASSLNTYNNIETYNSLPIEHVLNTIAKLAFSASICSNFNDPLILHFRIMNNNATMYKNFANIISNSQQFHSLILGKDYSNEYHGKNLGTIPILNFKRKIIICVYGADTFYRSTPLDEYINIVSGQAFMHLIRYNDIKYNPDKNLRDFNKKNMSIVLPSSQVELENPSFNLCREYGCQFIGMSFPNNDINLQQYNLFFNNNKSAFVLKPKVLRSSSTTPPTPIPPTPPYHQHQHQHQHNHHHHQHHQHQHHHTRTNTYAYTNTNTTVHHLKTILLNVGYILVLVILMRNVNLNLVMIGQLMGNQCRGTCLFGTRTIKM